QTTTSIANSLIFYPVDFIRYCPLDSLHNLPVNMVMSDDSQPNGNDSEPKKPEDAQSNGNGSVPKKRMNLRTPEIMKLVQEQVESHYRSPVVEYLRHTNQPLS